MKLVGPITTRAASGGAGAPTSKDPTVIPIDGYVMAVYLKYLDSPPAGTTDVTVATSGVNHPAVTILAKSNNATDGWFYPQTPIHLNSDGSVISNSYSSGVPICDTVKVTIAQANDNDYAQVWLLVDGG